MTTAAPIQTRIALLLGIVAALGLAAFMLMRSGGGSDEPVAAAPIARTPAAKPAAAPKPTTQNRVTPAKPTIVLNPGLPANLAKALRRERVVVAAVYAPGAGYLAAVAQARAGAREVGAGFVTLNVLREQQARALEALVGPISDPSVLVFERPGTVALRLDGYADSTLVAQAAQNAGAR